jgi:MSHA pilin protein MshA
MKNRAMKGFTLVELVVVLVILSILGAIIAPKVFDLSGSARLAAAKSMQASVSSASQLAHALQVAQGLAASANVTVEGNAITMANGYPTANNAGIVQAVQYDSTVFQTSGAGPINFQMITAGTPANCQVTYTAATATVPALTTTNASATNCQ